MLELDKLFVLSEQGGTLLSKFAMAVKKRAIDIAETETNKTAPRYLAAQAAARQRNWKMLASQVIDYASSQAGNALSEKGDALTDAEIEQVVQAYLPKVIALVGTSV